MPPKHENGGKKMQKWGQKAPSKRENGGKKRPQNHKVGAESAPAQIRAEVVI